MDLNTMLTLEQSVAAIENSSYANKLERIYQRKSAQLQKLQSDRKSLRFLVLQAEADAIFQTLEQFFRK
jgi:hypothetical protein